MAKRRNFSPSEYWNRLAENHIPEMAFRGSTRADFQQWESVARPKFTELLGRFPEQVPLNAEVISTTRAI